MTDPTTTRLGLQMIQPGDNVSVFPDAQNANCRILDSAISYGEGVLASRPDPAVAGRVYRATDDLSGGPAGTFYVDSASSWERINQGARGSSFIETSETRANTTYGTLTTPDQIPSITVAAPVGLIAVWYQAVWQESVSGAASANIFVGSTQLIQAFADGTDVANANAAIADGTTARWRPLATHGGGLASVNGYVPLGGVEAGYTGNRDVMSVGGGIVSFDTSISPPIAVTGYGPCYIQVGPGTYTVSVQFSASSGSVTVKNRHLYVEAKAF